MTGDVSWVQQYSLEQHPEGGWFRETYRSTTDVATDRGTRSCATAILYLLHPGESSAPHVVDADELWLHHRGGRLRLTVGDEVHLLGPDDPQVLVPAGVRQAAEPADDEPVLVSCLVAPGFDFADFRLV